MESLLSLNLKHITSNGLYTVNMNVCIAQIIKEINYSVLIKFTEVVYNLDK